MSGNRKKDQIEINEFKERKKECIEKERGERKTEREREQTEKKRLDGREPT
jgi:hypothetical protein